MPFFTIFIDILKFKADSIRRNGSIVDIFLKILLFVGAFGLYWN